MSFQQHPLSAAYPAMQPHEYQGLLDSIENIGVQVPITLFEGQVIDGWHRYRAATELGMPCPSVELGDVDPRDFAKSQGARRNISPSQTAMAITTIYAWRPHGDQRSAVTADRGVKTTKELATIAGVGTRTIEQAKAVHAGGVQAVQDAVKTGAVSVETAAAVAKLPAKEQKKIAAQGPEAMRAAAKPALKASKPAAEPEPENHDLAEAVFTINELAAENEQLRDRLAVEAMDASEEEKTAAAQTIAELRHQIRTLEAELAATRASRDGYQRQNSELMKQVQIQQRQLKKAA